jgi:hypothetical protein
MTERETVDRLVTLLAARDPFVHVRFGDGDVFFATGTGPKLTADGEHWTVELGARLRHAWQTLATIVQPLLVGDVDTYEVSDGCEEQWHQLLDEATLLRGRPPELVHIEALRVGRGYALDFYEAVAADDRWKVLVGPEYLAAAAAMLDAEHIEIPLHVAHEEATVNRVVDYLLDSGHQVALFAAGRGGKIMQAEVAANRLFITQVDVGSGLDILFGGVRRGTDGGVDADAVRRTYRRAGLLVA